MPRTRKRFRLIPLTVAVLVASSMFVLSLNAVDNSLTPIDREYIPLYLSEVETLPEQPSYEQELEFIRDVQDAVLTIAPGNEGLPAEAGREPRDLYGARSGLCYDRSRVIEKILRYSGLRTRHIAMYATRGDSAFRTLISLEAESHAISEVLTSRGWLVVDSNDRWLSTDDQGNPVPMRRIQSANAGESLPISWGHPPPSWIYRERFTFLYGLYSRHGLYYPPYNRIPDINYRELIQNAIPSVR